MFKLHFTEKDWDYAIIGFSVVQIKLPLQISSGLTITGQ